VATKQPPKPAQPLPKTGFVRVDQIVGPGRPIPCARSTWWQGVKDGKFPQPVKLAENITAWRVEDIRYLIGRLGSRAA